MGRPVWHLDVRRGRGSSALLGAVHGHRPGCLPAFDAPASTSPERHADRALQLLLPLEDAHPNEYEVVEGIGFAHYIKQDYAQARDYLERSAGIRAPDTTLLNAVGDCYERLGENAKAKEYYERSLELNPQQEGVKVRIEGLDSAGNGSP